MSDESETLYALPVQHANSFAPDEFKEIVANFQDVDSDGGGSIGADELATVFTRLGFTPDPDDVAALLAEVDTDGSGVVEFAEFVDMMYKFKSGGMGNARFDKMLSMLNSNPINMLADKAADQRLTATYRVLEERSADAMSEACIVMEVTIAGLFKEVVDRKVVSEEKSESFQGIASNTRTAKCNAASAALRHLKASLPGLHCAPGEIPSEWLSWYRRNIERGVNPSSLLDALVTKGFSPSLNIELMQWTHARQSLLRVEAERPGLTAVTSKGMPVPIPVEWAEWLDNNRKMGVSGKALAQILSDHERDRAREFAASSTAAAMVANHAYAAGGGQSDTKSIATRSSGGSSLVAAEEIARGMKWGSQYDPRHRQQLHQHLERWQPEARQHVDDAAFKAAPGQYSAISTDIAQTVGRRGVRQDRTKIATGTQQARLKHWGMDGGRGPGLGPTLMRWFESVISNDIPHVQRYIAAGQDLDVTETFSGRRRSGLSLAAESGLVECALIILRGGASPNGGADETEPPLHVACRCGHLNVVKELVEKGASVNSTDCSLNTPLHKAAGGGHRDIVHWLASHQEERQRWFFVSLGFNKAIMKIMTSVTASHVPNFKHQNFDKKWFAEATDMLFNFDHGEFNGILPQPHKSIIADVLKRMDPHPEVPTMDTMNSRDKRAFTRLMKSILSETFLNGGNRAGQTPLHMAVDPPSVGAISVKLLPRFVDTVRCLVEEHYVISTAVDGFGRTAMDCLKRRGLKLRAPITKFLGARNLELREETAREALSSAAHMERAMSVASSRIESPQHIDSDSDSDDPPLSPASEATATLSVLSAATSNDPLSPRAVTPRGAGLAAARAMRPDYAASAVTSLAGQVQRRPHPRPPPPRVKTPTVWPGTLMKAMWRYEWDTSTLHARHQKLIFETKQSDTEANAALVAVYRATIAELIEKQKREIASTLEAEKKEIAALADVHADQIFEAEAHAEILRNKAKRAEKKAKKAREAEEARRKEAGEPTLAEEEAASRAEAEGDVFSGLESRPGSAMGMEGASALDLFSADEASDLGPLKEKHYKEMGILL